MTLEDVEVPDTAPHDGVIVQAHATVISAGTEVANYLGRTAERPPDRTDPYLPGYSFCGVVLDVGRGVIGFAPGDRVAGPFPHAAAVLETRPERLARCAVVPERVSDADAALTQLGCIALNGIRRAQIAPGDRVLVLGGGIVGLLAAVLASWCGAEHVVVVEPLESRRHVARRLGLAAAASRDAVADDRWDVVVEATGVPAAFTQSTEVVRTQGRVVLLGSTRGTITDFSPYEHVHRRGLTLVGAHVSTTPTAEGWTEAANRALLLRLIANGTLNLRPLITQMIPPERAGLAYATLADDPGSQLGVVIDWT